MSRESGRTVTLLLTDIEGSTRLLRQLGDRRHSELLAEHRKILRSAIMASSGQEVDAEGDGFFVAFGTAKDAIQAALTAQQAFENPHVARRKCFDFETLSELTVDAQSTPAGGGSPDACGTHWDNHGQDNRHHRRPHHLTDV